MSRLELLARPLALTALLAVAATASAATPTTAVCVKDCAGADARKPKTQINPGDRGQPQVQAQQPRAVEAQQPGAAQVQQPGAAAAAHTHEGHAPDAHAHPQH